MILLPFVFLSCYVFPIGGMPLVFQYLTYLIPANYFLQIVRGIVPAGGEHRGDVAADRVAVVAHGHHHRAGDREVQEDCGLSAWTSRRPASAQ